VTALILLIALPLVLVLVVPFARRPRALAALPLAAGLLGGVALVLAPAATVQRNWVAPFTLEFALTGHARLLLTFALVFEVMTGLAALATTVRARRPKLLVGSLLLSFAAAAGVVLSANVLVLLVFWELFLVALYGAIASGGKAAEPAALKALLIGGASDFLMVLGLMLYLLLGGSPTADVPLATASSPTALAAFVLVFLGAGAKLGMFPFHTWIPDAAAVMPATGFAAIPASLEKIVGAAFLFTLTSRMFTIDAAARAVMLGFGLVTAFVVLAPALVERNLKRALALAGIAPAGFIVLGMAASEAAGALGALFYALAHATYKSGMFLAAGALEDRTGTAELAGLKGLGRVVPAVGLGFGLAWVAAIGLPPSAGFLAKDLILEGLQERGLVAVLALLAIAAAVSAAVYTKLLAVIAGPVDGEPAAPTQVTEAPVLVLGVLALVGGFILTALAPAVALEEHVDVAAVWHLGPLMLVSLGVCLLGVMLYQAARGRVETAAEAFDGLRESPVVGPGLALAAAKRLDAYEIALRVVEWVTRLVFRHAERLIDVVADGLVGIGRAVAGPLLSAVHSGRYGTYLGWTVAGFLVVLGMLVLS
jgi:formate hydrogenlyase subunit 3/multisubunit Na+/H+ antiporter MnhD subunit